MVLELYNNPKEPNFVNKTPHLRLIKSMGGELRERCSIINPSILLQDTSFRFTEVNYAYIEEFDRYYFIDDITIVGTNLVQIDLSIDVLNTYKTLIDENSAYIDRNQFATNQNLVDDKRIFETGVNIEDIHISNDVFEINEYGHYGVCYALSGFHISPVEREMPL